MEIRKLIKEVFDVESLERSIQNFENNVKEQSQILNNIKLQKNELVREKSVRDAQEKEIAKFKQQMAAQQAKTLADNKSGIGTRATISKQSGTSATA